MTVLFNLTPYIYIGIALMLHGVTLLAVLLFGKIEKDEYGRLVLDAESWHFKVAYPYNNKNENFLRKLEDRGLGLCRYCLRLSLMVYIVWEFIILSHIVLFIFIFCVLYPIRIFALLVYTVILFLIGMHLSKSTWCWPWHFINFLAKDKPHNVLPENIGFFKGKRFMFRPIYVPLSILYVYAFYNWNSPTVSNDIYIPGPISLFSLTVLIIAVVLLVTLRIISFVLRKKSQKPKTSLLREWFISRYIKSFCPRMKIITHLPAIEVEVPLQE